MIYTDRYFSPIGELTIENDGESLLYLRLAPCRSDKCENSISLRTKKWLDAYFDGKEPKDSLSVALNGTAFSQRVWKRLMKIPYGQTVTYGQIALDIAKETGVEKMSAQAVGNAVGKNPIAIIIPCHRVLASGNKIGGYHYGTDIKKALLEFENIKYYL